MKTPLPRLPTNSPSRMTGLPRTSTVRTDGIARLLVINHREFHELMDEFPAIRQAVLQALADRVRKDEPDTT